MHSLMRFQFPRLILILLTVITATHATISPSARAHWMRTAISALSDLSSPCPFAAFGAAIVNHTSLDPLGTLICTGINQNFETGNPTLHGEMAAINNCSEILKDPEGPYGLTAAELMDAWKDLSLYTTAESCPMVCCIHFCLL